jgi:hypothetical protein
MVYGKILSQLVNYAKLIEINSDQTEGTIFNLPLSDWEKEFEELVIEKVEKILDTRSEP